MIFGTIAKCGLVLVMYTLAPFLRSLPLCLVNRPQACASLTLRLKSRKYTTHRDPSSSPLSQSLDQRTREARTTDSVGPFPLGISQRYSNHDEKVKKWSELSTSGKGTFAISSSTPSPTSIYCKPNQLCAPPHGQQI